MLKNIIIALCFSAIVIPATAIGSYQSDERSTERYIQTVIDRVGDVSGERSEMKGARLVHAMSEVFSENIKNYPNMPESKKFMNWFVTASCTGLFHHHMSDKHKKLFQDSGFHLNGIGSIAGDNSDERFLLVQAIDNMVLAANYMDEQRGGTIDVSGTPINLYSFFHAIHSLKGLFDEDQTISNQCEAVKAYALLSKLRLERDETVSLSDLYYNSIETSDLFRRRAGIELDPEHKNIDYFRGLLRGERIQQIFGIVLD